MPHDGLVRLTFLAFRFQPQRQGGFIKQPAPIRVRVQPTPVRPQRRRDAFLGFEQLLVADHAPALVPLRRAPLPVPPSPAVRGHGAGGGHRPFPIPTRIRPFAVEVKPLRRAGRHAHPQNEPIPVPSRVQKTVVGPFRRQLFRVQHVHIRRKFRIRPPHHIRRVAVSHAHHVVAGLVPAFLSHAFRVRFAAAVRPRPERAHLAVEIEHAPALVRRLLHVRHCPFRQPGHVHPVRQEPRRTPLHRLGVAHRFLDGGRDAVNRCVTPQPGSGPELAAPAEHIQPRQTQVLVRPPRHRPLARMPKLQPFVIVRVLPIGREQELAWLRRIRLARMFPRPFHRVRQRQHKFPLRKPIRFAVVDVEHAACVPFVVAPGLDLRRQIMPDHLLLRLAARGFVFAHRQNHCAGMLNQGPHHQLPAAPRFPAPVAPEQNHHLDSLLNRRADVRPIIRLQLEPHGVGVGPGDDGPALAQQVRQVRLPGGRAQQPHHLRRARQRQERMRRFPLQQFLRQLQRAIIHCHSSRRRC